MRRVRPEATASVRQVRTATLWAFAFSVGAAVAALAIPLLVMHAVATQAGQLSRQAFALIAAATLAALFLRGMLLSARSRTLTRAALWLSHALGAQALTHGLDAVRSPNDLDRDRNSLDVVARALPQLATLFDALLLILPLAVLVMLSPVLSLVTLGAVGVTLATALHLATTSRTHFKVADTARAEADGAWRTAAASSVVIAARGMTARAVDDWQALSGRAIARGYGEAQRLERALSIATTIRHVALVTLLMTSALVFESSHLGVGAFAAILLLHEGIMRVLTSALERVPDVLAAQKHLDLLMTVTPHAFNTGHSTDQSAPVQSAPIARPIPDRQTVAS